METKIRGRKKGEKVNLYQCSSCQYESSRLYNVSRHEQRIHSTMRKKRFCCGLGFRTKGEFYLHCEEEHPHSRGGSILSRNKYKIVAGRVNLKTEEPEGPEEIIVEARNTHYMLRNRRRIMPKIESSSEDDDGDDEDSSEDDRDDEDSSEDNRDDEDSSEDDREVEEKFCSPKSSGYGTCLETENDSSLNISTNQSSEDVSEFSEKSMTEETWTTLLNVISVFYDEELRQCPSSFTEEKKPLQEIKVPSDGNIVDENRRYEERKVTTTWSLSTVTTLSDLPIKKRILQNFATNDEIPMTINTNIAEHEKRRCIDGERRAGTRTPKKHRLAKKQRLRENDENICPLSSVEQKENEKTPDLKITWEKISVDTTQQHRDYLLDFLREFDLP